jgi:imidazolonepropionase-like amidohydrolase
MKRPLLSTALLAVFACLTPATRAQTAPAAEDATRVLIRAGTLHIGNGEVRKNVLVAIENGKIAGISDDNPAKPNSSFTKYPVLDLRKRTVVPGFVAAFSARAAADKDYNLTPDIRAAENYELFEKDETLIKAGITSVYLNPGNRRLMPGIGSVVKTAGEEPEARVVRMDAALRINLSAVARNNVPAVFEPVMSPTSENPLKPARRQLGTARSSQIDVLEAAFAEARDSGAEYGGEGPAESRYALQPLRDALAGRLPVRLMAQSAADIMHGLDFAERMGFKVILEMPSEADKLTERLQQAGVPAVISLPIQPGQKLAGDYLPSDPELRLPCPGQAGKLARSGVQVALVPSNENELGNLRMAAGLASRFGLPRKLALPAITLDAAHALGVAERVGSIEKGKDADLVVLTGAPFDSRSRITRVMVDGRTVHEAEAAETTLFAIRVGRMLRGDGTEERNALVIVKDGRIYDAGSNASLPPGCKVYDAPNAVLTPGFVDAESSLGLHMDAMRGRPGAAANIPAKTDVDVVGALEHDDEIWSVARMAGVTSVFVTPNDSGLVGPRVAAVRTAGKQEGFVVQPLSAVRMTVTASGPQGEKQILAAIDKAKKYFAAKNAPKKEEPKKEPEKKPEEAKEGAAKKSDPVTGSWSGTLTGAAPRPIPLSAELELKGKDVSGSFRFPMAPQPIEVSGSWAAPKLTVKATVPGAGTLTFEATITGTTMKGTVKGAPTPASFEMTREGDKPAATANKPSSKPKKDAKLDENLEPFGPVLNREIPLVVRFKGRAAAQTAIDAILKKSKLRLVLAPSSQSDVVAIAKEPLELPRDTRIGLLLDVTQLMYRKDEIELNLAQYLTERGIDPILVSRAQTGAMLLPVHASWAVANGLDPRHALRAITSNPARHFGVADEIGSVETGKSADFVLLDGDPFDLQSRVLGVWVAGKQCYGSWDEIRGALEEVK